MKRAFLFGGVAVAALVAFAAISHARHGHWSGHGYGGDHGSYGRYAEDGERRGHGRGHGRWGQGHGHRKHLKKMFEEADANNDGALSKEEIDAARAKRFGEMDANGDGQVNAEELVAFRMKKRAERMIARRDKDGDGQLSIDELPNPGQRLMRFDLDENGVVTKTELRTARKAMRGRGWRRHGWDDESSRRRGGDMMERDGEAPSGEAESNEQ